MLGLLLAQKELAKVSQWLVLAAETGARLVGGLIAAAVGLAQPAGPPNILLLVAEDLSPRIGAWGDEIASTPNIDALARQSVRYTQAFTAAGVCAPSRGAGRGAVGSTSSIR